MREVEDLDLSLIEVVEDLSFEVIKDLDLIEVVKVVKDLSFEVVEGLSFEVIEDLDLIEVVEIVEDLSSEVIEDLDSIEVISKASLEALILDFIDLL